METLKEWAAVVAALNGGDQSVILRKGGIMETASGFDVPARRFLLFPTYEHQQEDHVREEFRHYIHEAQDGAPADGTNTISSYAEVLKERDVSSAKELASLEPLHIWSSSYVDARVAWMPQRPLRAVLLRVFRTPPLTIQQRPEYGGCKSWIDVDVRFQEGKSVLEDSKVRNALERFEGATR